MALGTFFSAAVVASTFCRLGAAAVQAPLGLFSAASERGSQNPFNDDLGNFVDNVMERWKIPGMSVAVIDGDDVYTEGYGFATLPDTKATPDTLYFAGSTSKAFVAATLALMIDSKNYTALSEGWSTSISSIIRDDFVLQDSWSTENINLDDAVSHRTGMPRHDMAWPRYHQDGRKVTTAEAVRLLRHLKPSAPPRTTWQYCNFMFVVLGHVVETLTGQWLGDAIREKIWNPLGMTATFGDTKDAVAATEDLAEGYYWDSEKSAYQKLRLDSTRESSGAGLVISTVTDYSKWVRCLLDQTRPFSKDAHKDIRKTRVLMPAEEKTGPGDITYSLAWMKKTYHGEVVYKHGGTELAYSTQVYWLPGRRYGVVVMANTGYSNSAEDEVVWRLIEDKLGVPEDKRFNLSANYEDYMKKIEKGVQNVPDEIYPDRPKPPLPSPLNNSQIVGKYFNPGYGYLDILEAQIDGDSMLVANRSNMLTPYELRLNHTSANYWLSYVYINDQHGLAGAWGTEFKVGVDGMPTGVELQLSQPGEENGEGNVLFKRVK